MGRHQVASSCDHWESIGQVTQSCDHNKACVVKEIMSLYIL